jgi:hypothetical protein
MHLKQDAEKTRIKTTRSQLISTILSDKRNDPFSADHIHRTNRLRAKYASQSRCKKPQGKIRVPGRTIAPRDKRLMREVKQHRYE